MEERMPAGYYNGTPYYSRDEGVYMRRHFGAIESDEELLAYAEKVTSGWSDSGWKQPFTHFYLSDYCYARPYEYLTRKEFERLKELQKIAIEEYKAAEKAREWKLVETVFWADNSEEEIWEDKDGNRKTVMTVAPHGDACY